MRQKGFTLIELMVVILIVGILAAASVPLMRGRIESAKWSEANAMAGTIRSAVRVAFAENETATRTEVEGKQLSNTDAQKRLGFNPGDLIGTYFTPEAFTVTSINGNGVAVVTVNGAASTSPKKPTGTYVLNLDGDWAKQ